DDRHRDDDQRGHGADRRCPLRGRVLPAAAALADARAARRRRARARHEPAAPDRRRPARASAGARGERPGDDHRPAPAGPRPDRGGDHLRAHDVPARPGLPVVRAHRPRRGAGRRGGPPDRRLRDAVGGAGRRQRPRRGPGRRRRRGGAGRPM
ncbi:MAG: Na(+) H(+) antiporter subunit C, partial [uncultured Pseudonocardia sp.]